MHYAFLVVSVNRVAIRWIEEHIKSIGARKWCPIAIPDPFFAADRARTNPVAIILQSAGDAINRARIV